MMRVIITIRGWMALLAFLLAGAAPAPAQLGEIWREAWQYPYRSFPASTVHDGRLWVVGGQYYYGSSGPGGGGDPGITPLALRRDVSFPIPPMSINRSDVWVSDNGSHWEPVTTRAAFPPRSLHSLTSFHGALWIMGGFAESGEPLNDIWMSVDGETWSIATNDPGWSPRGGHSVTVFDGGLWLIGGTETPLFESERIVSDEVWFSADGFDWVNLTLSPHFPPRFEHGVTVHDGAMWLAGGIGETETALADVWTSAEGTVWTQVPQGPAPLPQMFMPKLASWQGQLWVAGGRAGTDPFALSSIDGANWNPSLTVAPGIVGHQLHAFHQRLHLVHAGTLSLSSSRADRHFSTRDGLNWIPSQPSRAFSGRYGHSLVLHEGRLHLIGGYDGYHRSDVWTSHDGIHWDLLRSNPALTNRLAHRAFVAPNTSGVPQINVLAGVGEDGYRRDRWVSTNGIDWSLAETGTAGSFVFNNGRFGLIVDDRNPAAVQVLVIGGLAPGNVPTKEVHRKTFSSSPSGWVVRNATPAFPARHGHGAALFNNRYWIVGGVSSSAFLGDIWSSADGVTWVQETPVGPAFDARSDHVVMEHEGALWVIGGVGVGGARKDAWYTTDGTSWTRATDSLPFPNGLYLEGISAGDSMWIVIGAGSTTPHSSVWRSHDGVTWQRMNPGGSYGARRGHAMAPLAGGMALTGGFDGEHTRGDSWWSADGRLWQPMAGLVPERRYHAAAVLDDRLYVMGGEADDGSFRNDVWSTDSPTTSWTQDTASAAFTQRRYHAATTHADFLQLMAGQDTGLLRDIRRSPDGSSWSGGTISIITPRIGHRVFSLGEHMYLVGGYNAGYLQDMWRSPEGITWEEVTLASNVRPPKRFHHRGTAFDDTLWLIGGYDGDTSTAQSDVWTSTGTGWQRVATSDTTPFTNRQFHDVAAANHKLWVAGGVEVADPHLGDVWLSNQPPRLVTLEFVRSDYSRGETVEVLVEFNKDVQGFDTDTAFAVPIPDPEHLLPLTVTPLEGTRRWLISVPYPETGHLSGMAVGIWRPWEIRDDEGDILSTGIAEAIILAYPPADYMAVYGPGGIIILP